jgi:ribonuclease G
LGKYRDLAPATPDAAGPEAERQVFEHERIQPDSPAHAPVAVDAAELAASDNAYDEADSDASDDTIDGDVAGEAEAGEESAEASAAVRADSGEARLQAPAPREDRDGREGRRGRHRRRRRGGQRGPAAAPAAGAESGESADAVEAAAPPAPPARRSEGKNESSRLIGDLLHPGQEILIQIAKEPLGKKGARITSHLALPGRYLVYMPTVSHIGVSRKISSDEERARLKRLILENSQDLPGGFIVRTAGAAATDEEFKADIRLLANQWKDMRQQFDQVRGPALLHHDLSLVERTLRDQLSNEFSHIWVDTDEQYQRIVKFVGYFMPHLVDRVRLYTRDEPMFEHFGIQEEINKGLKSKVWLKSGGYIVINQTEALVAIDVNTGKYVGKSNRLEDTIVKTNVDAIKEIVRQIRLRDLGGIIVIDFIDMDERRNRQRVMQALDEAMRADRAPSKVLAFNDFGLVALTRKRVKQSLERTLGSACPYCEGVGLVKSATTVCNEIYAEVRKTAPTIDREDVVLRVNPEIAKALKGQGGQRLREMEDLTRKAISVRPDPLVHQEQFEIY